MEKILLFFIRIPIVFLSKQNAPDNGSGNGLPQLLSNNDTKVLHILTWDQVWSDEWLHRTPCHYARTSSCWWPSPHGIPWWRPYTSWAGPAWASTCPTVETGPRSANTGDGVTPVGTGHDSGPLLRPGNSLLKLVGPLLRPGNSLLRLVGPLLRPGNSIFLLLLLDQVTVT